MTEEEIFRFRRWDGQKLLDYGFTGTGQSYALSVPLSDGQFFLQIRIENGQAATDVIEADTGEPFVLYRIKEAGGAFIGALRGEAEELLLRIAERCSQREVFSFPQTKRLLSRVRERYGVQEEYLWEKFPDNAVLRRKDTNKWYAAILSTDAAKFGLAAGRTELIDLRETPEEIDALADGTTYFRGYHMNKRHWYTILLNDGVSDGELERRIEKSYALAK